MQINPGGRLNTRDAVGRDNEIARYWQVLERQGLVISAERRLRLSRNSSTCAGTATRLSRTIGFAKS